MLTIAGLLIMFVLGCVCGRWYEIRRRTSARRIGWAVPGMTRQHSGAKQNGKEVAWSGRAS